MISLVPQHKRPNQKHKTIHIMDNTTVLTLKNQNGEEVTIPATGKKTVLLFFPLAFTGVCTKELCSVRDNFEKYNELDATVYGISVDSFFTLNKFKTEHNLQFDLLSDFNKEASKAYGCLYDTFHGMNGVSKRSAFVLNEKGEIIHSEILEDAGQIPNFDAVVSALN